MELLPTNVRPLDLPIESKVLADEWLFCIDKKDSDLKKLLLMIRPALKIWAKYFLGIIDGREDINYVTLCKLLSSNMLEATQMIQNWVSWVGKENLLSELEFIFIGQIRKIRYSPNLASPRMVEYIIARDLKTGIYNHIRKTNRLLKRDALHYCDDNTNFTTETFSPTEHDSLLRSRTEKLGQWGTYLAHLVQDGYTSVERAKLLHLDRRNLYREEEKIWHLLRKKQLNS